MSTNTPTPEELEQMTDDAVSQATTGTTTADLERISDSTGNMITDALADGYAEMTRWSATYGLEVPTPYLNLTEGGVASVMGGLMWVAAPAALVSLAWYAVRIAMAPARGDNNVAGDTGVFILRLVFMLTMFFPLITLVSTIIDEAKDWMLRDAMEEGLGDNLVEALTITGPVSWIIMAIVYGIMMICSFVVLVFFIIKGPVLIFLTALLVIIACCASGRAGIKWFWTVLGWIVSFEVVTLALAVIYSSAFRMMGDQPIMEGGGPQFMYGFVLMVCATISWPALTGLIHAGFATLGGAGGMAAVMGGASMAARYSATKFDSKTGKSSPAENSGPVAQPSRSERAERTTATNNTKHTSGGTPGTVGRRGTQGANGTSKANTTTHTGPKATKATRTAATGAGASAGGPASAGVVLAAKAGKKAAVGAKNTTDRAIKG